jgi:hypothetical protein
MKDYQYHIFYCDSSCILVINPKGAIRKIYTPFRVLELQDENSEKEKWWFVDEVHIDKKDKLLYLIKGNLYP